MLVYMFCCEWVLPRLKLLVRKAERVVGGRLVGVLEPGWLWGHVVGMKVLVTGGTGLVGSHTVAAMVQGGHEVRLLVRRPGQVPVSLGPLGVAVTDIVVGDVLDEDLVSRAIEGCEAVVHAAAVLSMHPRRAEEIRRTNARAAELVLGRAVDRGLDPVVHVSTSVALTRYGGSGPDLPLGDIELPYAQSKIASEKVARQLQDAGAPVVIIYPGAVFGPHDPYRGEQSERLRWILLGRFPLWPRGGVHVVDVRDVAAVIAAVLNPGRGPRRYIVPGYHMDGNQLYAAVRGCHRATVSPPDCAGAGAGSLDPRKRRRRRLAAGAMALPG